MINGVLGSLLVYWLPDKDRMGEELGQATGSDMVPDLVEEQVNRRGDKGVDKNLIMARTLPTNMDMLMIM